MYIIWMAVPVLLLFFLFRQGLQDARESASPNGEPTGLIRSNLEEQRARLERLQAAKEALPTLDGADLFKSEHKDELFAAAETLRHLIVDVVGKHSPGELPSDVPNEIPLDLRMARALIELGKAQVAVSITAAESEIKRLELEETNGTFTNWAATAEYKNDIRRLDSERDRLEAIVRGAETELRRVYLSQSGKQLPRE